MQPQMQLMLLPKKKTAKSIKIMLWTAHSHLFYKLGKLKKVDKMQLKLFHKDNSDYPLMIA